MSVKRILGLTAGIVFALAIGAAVVKSGGGDQANKSPEPVAPVGGVPPDIKPGVKVEFISPGVQSYTEDAGRAPKVAKVHGQWVYLEGELWTSKNRGSGWINFNAVSWYRVVKEK